MNSYPKEQAKLDSEKIRINIWLSQEMHSQINLLGDLDNRSMSDVIREALRDYLGKHMGRIGGADGRT